MSKTIIVEDTKKGKDKADPFLKLNFQLTEKEGMKVSTDSYGFDTLYQIGLLEMYKDKLIRDLKGGK